MDFERDEGKTLACCARLQSDVDRAEIEEEPDAESIRVRDLPGTVTRIENLTPTIQGIFIETDEPMHFQAGQYVNFFLEGGEYSRAFSLANPAVDRARGRAQHPRRAGRSGTTWVHEKLQVGERVRRGPTVASSCASRRRSRCCSWRAGRDFPVRAR